MNSTKMIIVGCIVFVVVASFVAVMSMGGCRDNSSRAALRNSNSSNIERLSNLYVMYQVTHRFRGPEDAAQFREFILSVDESRLNLMGIKKSEIDELFLNESDLTPFKIRYRVPGGPRGTNNPVIFESNPGLNGKRRIAFTSMSTKEVDDVEYESYWKGEGDTVNTRPKYPGEQ